MSLILDALRRSDDRRAQLESHRTRVRPVRPMDREHNPWPWVIVAALGLNLLLLVWLLLPGGEAETTDPVASVTPPPPQEDRAPPELDPPVPPPRTAPVRPATNPPSAPVETASTDPGPSADEAPAGREDAGGLPDLPLLANLPVSMRSTMPPLELQAHVYAEDPEQRFVMIDSRRLSEGERTADGQRVVRIHPEAVEMEHRGQRFLIPRR